MEHRPNGAADRASCGWDQQRRDRRDAQTALEQVEREISKLIHAGAIASRHGLLWSHPDSYVQGRERTRRDVAADVGRLYINGESYKPIADALTLTEAQVHNILSELFAEGMPKRNKRHALTDRQARAIHGAYLKGEGSLNKLAAEIGFSGAAVRKRMHKLHLPIAKRRDMAAEPDQSPDAA